jgi:hypothetical protein
MGLPFLNLYGMLCLPVRSASATGFTLATDKEKTIGSLAAANESYGRYYPEGQPVPFFNGSLSLSAYSSG